MGPARNSIVIIISFPLTLLLLLVCTDTPFPMLCKMLGILITCRSFTFHRYNTVSSLDATSRLDLEQFKKACLELEYTCIILHADVPGLELSPLKADIQLCGVQLHTKKSNAFLYLSPEGVVVVTFIFLLGCAPSSFAVMAA